MPSASCGLSVQVMGPCVGGAALQGVGSPSSSAHYPQGPPFSHDLPLALPSHFGTHSTHSRSLGAIFLSQAHLQNTAHCSSNPGLEETHTRTHTRARGCADHFTTNSEKSTGRNLGSRGLSRSRARMASPSHDEKRGGVLAFHGSALSTTREWLSAARFQFL